MATRVIDEKLSASITISNSQHRHCEKWCSYTYRSKANKKTAVLTETYKSKDVCKLLTFIFQGKSSKNILAG